MRDVAEAFAEPVVKTFGNVEVKFHPLTFGILAQFEANAEREFKSNLQAETSRRLTEIAANTEGMAPYDRGRLMLQLYDAAPAFDLVAAMSTVRGSLQLLTLAAKMCDPTMTEERMGKLLPFDQRLVESLVNELTPVGTESVEEVRQELVMMARRRLESAIDNAEHDGHKATLAGIESALEPLYEVTGEVVPERYGGSSVPPAESASS